LQTGTSVDLMPKSPDAFRTISEVADWLGIQAHVLRFWESKFTQVKPIKRAGGRRYYRPADMLLLGGIKRMLHDDGLTIKGVQKVLREEGMNHVSALSAPLDELTQTDFADDGPEPIDMVAAEPEQRKSVVLPFEAGRAPHQETEDAQSTSEPVPERAVTKDEPEQVAASTEMAPAEPDQPVPAADPPVDPEGTPIDDMPDVENPKPDDMKNAVPPPQDKPVIAQNSVPETSEVTPKPLDVQAQPQPNDAAADESTAKEDDPNDELPAFLRQPLSDQPPEETQTEAPAVEVSAPKPRIIDVPTHIDEAAIPAAPGVLSAALNARSCTPAMAKDLAPLLSRLAALRDSMSSVRKPAAKD